jgi:hypothetical protein
MKLKVTASLTHGLHPMEVTPDGIKFNDAFIDRLYEKEEYFRERIILQINEVAGNDWAVHFTENPTVEPTFFVDISAEDRFLPGIMYIISTAFPEIELHFWKPNPYILIGKRKAIAEY